MIFGYGMEDKANQLDESKKQYVCCKNHQNLSLF